MTIATAFNDCELCVDRDREKARGKLVYGSKDSFALAVGSQAEVEKLLEDGFVTEDDVALTQTVRCSITSGIDKSNADFCSIYTRIISLAYTHFILTPSAWEQLKVEGEFENGVVVETDIGLVLCTTDLEKVLSSPKKIKDLLEKESYKIPRRKILEGTE